MRTPGVVRSTVSLMLAVTFAALVPLSATAATQTVNAGAGAGVSFAPRSPTVARGDQVVWHNVSGFPHDVTSRLSGYFRSNGHLGPGQDFAHTFTAAGSFGYFCVFHHAQGMTGTIVVPIRATLSGGLFTIRVGSASWAGTIWRNRVQVRKPGSSSWQTITTTARASVTYDPGRHGTYRFRSAVVNKGSGARSGFSPVVSKVY